MTAKKFTLQNYNGVTLLFRSFHIEELCRTGKHHLNGGGPCGCDPEEKGPGGRWTCEKCSNPTRGVSPRLAKPSNDRENRLLGNICDGCWIEGEFALGFAQQSFDRGELSMPEDPYNRFRRPRRQSGDTAYDPEDDPADA